MWLGEKYFRSALSLLAILEAEVNLAEVVDKLFSVPPIRACLSISRITRPDTRLPQSRAGGQGPYLRALDHLGRSSEAKDRKNPKKVKCDTPTD